MGFNITPITLVFNLIILLIAFPVHEFAHAWAANYFGDDTPRIMGRYTLNPLKHLDIMGSLMLLFAGFGWAKPVPVNPYALQRRSPSALMWVSLAGPLSNLVMALLATFVYRLGVQFVADQFSVALPYFTQFVLFFIYINLLLAFFNLIPLAPLDGEKVLSYFAPDSIARVMEQIRPYQPIILLGVVIIASRTGLLYAPVEWLFRLLTGT